jgi:hypothetical protein
MPPIVALLIVTLLSLSSPPAVQKLSILFLTVSLLEKICHINVYSGSVTDSRGIEEKSADEELDYDL